MSLFVCICKGDYDALQSWPFNLKINLTLLDQNEDVKARKHVSYMIKPNTCKENLAFLGRPVNDRNASFGSQRFLELSILGENDYIVNDCLYIKVEIEPQETVPY
jgi:TNF receptor-associated factor 4